jgi:hypothetical protein
VYLSPLRSPVAMVPDPVRWLWLAAGESAEVIKQAICIHEEVRTCLRMAPCHVTRLCDALVVRENFPGLTWCDVPPQDTGILWKHKDYRTNTSEARR